MTEADSKDFGTEAYMISKDVKSGDYTQFQAVFGQLSETVSVFFSRSNRLTQVEEEESFGLLRRAYTVIVGCIEDIPLTAIDPYIPSLIDMLDYFLEYKDHLLTVIYILIDIAILPGSGDDFMYTKFNFVLRIQEIFKEYPYNEDNAIIHENVYWILGNLAADRVKVRNVFFSEKFIQHIAYLLTEEDLKVEKSTLRTLTYVLSRFLLDKCDRNDLEHFNCIVKPLYTLLFIKDDDVIEHTIFCYSRLLSYTGVNSHLFNEIVTSEFIRQLLKVGNTHVTAIQKYTLRTIWNILAGDNELLKELVECDVWEILQDAVMDKTKNLEKEVLSWLWNLTLTDPETLLQIYHTNVLDMLVKYVGSGTATLMKPSLRAMINVFKSGDYDLCEELMVKGKQNLVRLYSQIVFNALFLIINNLFNYV